MNYNTYLIVIDKCLLLHWRVLITYEFIRIWMHYNIYRDLLAECQDNVTKWGKHGLMLVVWFSQCSSTIKSPLAHNRKSGSVLIWPLMLSGPKAPTTKDQPIYKMGLYKCNISAKQDVIVFGNIKLKASTFFNQSFFFNYIILT